MANVTYNYFKVNGVALADDGSTKVSFNSPYNSIDISFTVGSSQLVAYYIRVVKNGNTIDPFTGNLGYSATNLGANTTYTISLPVNSTIFNSGDGIYLIGLYSCLSNGNWDDVMFLVDTNGNYLRTSAGEYLTVPYNIAE